MSTSALLQQLLSILGNTNEYFISGSLSFLPLIQNYREPGRDIDILISKNAYQIIKNKLRDQADEHILSLAEVAVANTSIVTKIISPKTGFIHYETENGLIDLSLYLPSYRNIELILGAGFTLKMSNKFMKRLNEFNWKGYTYQAAPPELMFVTKSVELMRSYRKKNIKEFSKSKHYQDILQLSKIIDWEFAEEFLESISVCWNKINLPHTLDKKINPYKSVDLSVIRTLL